MYLYCNHTTKKSIKMKAKTLFTSTKLIIGTLIVALGSGIVFSYTM